MQLAEQGKLRLDAPVSKYLDAIPPEWQGITIRNLLSHSSGIKDDYAEEFHGSMLVDYKPEHLLQFARSQPLEFKPAERFAYNNLGYFLLTLIVERAAGLSYPRYLEDHIFAPLGMTSSSCPPLEAIVPNLASNYTIKNGELVIFRDYLVSQAGNSYCMNSSVTDLAKFEIALESGKVLKRESMTEMWTPYRLVDGTTGPVALGWWEGLRRASKFVAKGGRAGANYVRYPDRKLTVIILANLDGDAGVRYQELTNEIAGKYDPDLALPQSLPIDPDPERTRRIRTALTELVGGRVDTKEISSRLLAVFPAQVWQDVLGTQIRELRAFSYVSCEKVKEPWESFGVAVDSNCYYRIEFGNEMQTVRFELAKDGMIASIDTN